jgi:predicted  nucleic acid-binding Zn-ribbon protein
MLQLYIMSKQDIIVIINNNCNKCPYWKGYDFFVSVFRIENPKLLAISLITLYNFSMSQISILYRLQRIDSQLDKAHNTLRSIEKKLGDNSLLDAAQRKVTEAEDKLQAESKRLRNAQNKSHDVRVKMEQSESSLYGGKIQNPKELQDLQNGIASLKRLISTLEDNELDAMMAVEEAETHYNDVKVAIQEEQGKQIEKTAQLNDEKTKLLEKIERLEAERNATLPPISASDLSLYDQLRITRSGIAVAKISSQACDACGTTLTAAMIQSTQSTGQVIRCPTCGRILYPG